MSSTDRTKLLELEASSVKDGCTQKKACAVLGLSARTIQRWMLRPGLEDLRKGPLAAPNHKLSTAERDKILAISNSKEFCDKSPHQIVPTLADRGEYIASEATFYQILKAESLLSHRGKSKEKAVGKPRSHEATAPCQLFSWDITYLKSEI